MNKYINENDYLIAKGKKLSIELQDDDNISNKVPRFIKEVTDWCVDYIVSNYACNEIIDFDSLADFRKQRFIKGVIEQIEYVLDNGFINKDSGINNEHGMILNTKGLEFGYNARMQFKLGAFLESARY